MSTEGQIEEALGRLIEAIEELCTSVWYVSKETPLLAVLPDNRMDVIQGHLNAAKAAIESTGGSS